MTTGWLKADVWSLGCTVVEMVTGNLPYSYYDNPMTAMYHIANGDMPSFRDLSVSDELKALVVACCSADPTTRPTVVELRSLDFVSQLKRKYLKVVKGELVVEQLAEAQTSGEFQMVSQKLSPTVREGLELSVDMFTSLDESTDFHIREGVADSAKQISLNNTRCGEDPPLASTASSSSVSPVRRRISITESSMDTDAATVIHHQLYPSQRPRDISPPHSNAKSGAINIDHTGSSTRVKGIVANAVTASSTTVNSDAPPTVTNRMTTTSSHHNTNEVTPARKDKDEPSRSKDKSSQPSVISPTSARHLPRTFSGVFKRGTSTTATTPSNSVRREQNHNGPLVVKNPPSQDTKEIQEEKENCHKNVKNSFVTPSHSCSNLHESISTFRSLDTDNSNDANFSLKSMDETENLDSSYQDTIFNESDVLRNVDTMIRRGSYSSDAEDHTSAYDNVVADGIRFLSRSSSRCTLVAVAGRPPPAQSPCSPSVRSLSPHTIDRNGLDSKAGRGLRRIKSMSQEDLKSAENNKTGTKLCPLDIQGQDGSVDVCRRERSYSDLTLPFDVSYTRGNDLICKNEAFIAGGCGRGSRVKSIPRPTAPLSGELRRIGEPCNLSSCSLDRLGPLGLFDSATATDKILGSMEIKYSGGSSNDSYSSSGQSTGHSSGIRSESGSEKLERIAHSGAASIRASALRESEILANQHIGPVISSQARFKKNRKISNKICSSNFHGVNDALRSFSGNDVDAYGSSSNSSSKSSSAHHCFRSQSAGVLSTAHSLGIDVLAYKGSGAESKQHSHSVSNQLKPLGVLGGPGSGPGPGASAVHDSNITPHNAGMHPRTLGANLSHHLLPAMNLMLPLQRRIIQSAPSLSRSSGSGVHAAGSLPPILSQSDLTATTTRCEVEIVTRDVEHSKNKITRSHDARGMGSDSEDNSVRGKAGTFADR